MKCRCYAPFVRDDSRRNQDWSDIEIRSNFKSQRMLLFEKLSSCIVTYLVDKCKIWNFISTLLPRLIIVQSLKWFARSTNNCIVVRLVKSWSFSGCEFCERDSVGVERRKINKKGHCVVKKGSLIQPSRFCNQRLFINRLSLSIIYRKRNRTFEYCSEKSERFPRFLGISFYGKIPFGI